MQVSVLTPDKEIFQGEITSVKLPGISGEFEVLENHAAIVSALGNGNVRIAQSNGVEMRFSINKGFVEVLNNKVSLLIQGYAEI